MTKLFNALPNDVILEIFTFDNTYKEKYTKIINDTLDHRDIRALKSFLHNDVEIWIPVNIMAFNDWLSMRQFMFMKERYYEVSYKNSTLVFHIIPFNRELLHHSMDSHSSKIIRDILRKLSIEYLERNTNCSVDILKEIKDYVDDDKYKDVVISHVEVNSFHDLFNYLCDNEMGGEVFHEYFFKQLVNERIGFKMYLEDEQTNNWNIIFNSNDEYFMVLWYEY